MPELPEVETVVRELRPRLAGRRITAVRAGRKPLRRRWEKQWEAQLIGQRITALERRGKWIVLRLEGTHQLVIHLGMTGQLTVMPAETSLAKHTHLVFDLEDGREQLRFRDIRRFGSATLFNEPEQVQRFFEEAKLGPEPFQLDSRYWRDRLASARRSLKAVLLDQRVVAGVGNIYADESLFEAGLPPARLGCELDARQAEQLRQAIVLVLKRAIKRRGSTIREYVGGSGRKGGYQNEFRVYGQTGRPCPRCGQPIQCMRLAGRATHFCPRCQREKTRR